MIKPFFKLKARNMDKSFMKNPLVLDWNSFIKAGKVYRKVNVAYDCKSDVYLWNSIYGTCYMRCFTENCSLMIMTACVCIRLESFRIVF